MTQRNFLVRLDVTTEGPLYLGKLTRGDANQGVFLVENANKYTERGARQLAAQYPGAAVVVVPA